MRCRRGQLQDRRRMRAVNDRSGTLLSLRCTVIQAAIATVLLLAGCGGNVIESVRENGKVSLDGKYTEWNGCLYSVGGGKTSVGCMNDSVSLYLCLVSYDPQVVMQIMHGGCRVRFGKGRQMRDLPEVLVLAGGRRYRTAGAEEPGFDDGSDMVGGQTEECMVRLIEPNDSGSGQHPPFNRDAPVDTSHAVRAVVRNDNGCAVLEMVIPFDLRNAGAVMPVVNDSLVYLTVETRTPRRFGRNGGGSPHSDHRGMGPPPSDRGAGGGMNHGYGGGHGASGDGERFRPDDERQPFSLKTVIRIAG